jgi:hypothetical protein
LLTGERLVAIARPDSRVNEHQNIPASAWAGLRPVAWKRPSSLRERPSKTAGLFDVRVYPVLEAPQAASILHDMTLVDALDQYVWRDPQAETLRAYASASGGKTADFGWNVDRVWPVSYDEEFVWSGLIGFADAAGTTAGKRADAADAIVARRFASFVGLLAKGEMEAEGLPPQGGALTAVPKSVWKQSGVHVEVA